MNHDLQEINHNNQISMWAERVSACRSSGLTVRQWCKDNGVAQATYYSWQKKVLQAVQQQHEIYFSEIPAEQTVSNHIIATVKLGELQADIYSGADAETVRNVIAALKSC